VVFGLAVLELLDVGSVDPADLVSLRVAELVLDLAIQFLLLDVAIDLNHFVTGVIVDILD